MRKHFVLLLTIGLAQSIQAQVPNVEWKFNDSVTGKNRERVAVTENVTAGPFQPTWESLKKYQCPEWFRDAKFGLFMHWSVNSVVPGGNDGWYGRQMYMQQKAPWGNAYEFQVKTFGHPSQFGYKDLIPLWKAEQFHPADLVSLFKKAGARYIVPVAVHHDNFDCYASTYQPWNSVNMGPKRDLIGEWEKAIRQAGLKFGVSSHSDRAWGWYEFVRGSDSEGPLKGVPYDGVQTKADGKGKWWEGYDPVELYGPVSRPGGTSPAAKADADRYQTTWLNRTLELVNHYRPDLIYFDGGMPMGDLGLQVTASLYNNHARNGKTDSVLNIKWNPPRAACVEDLEKGLSSEIRPLPWQLDASINSMWFTDHLPLELTAAQIVHTLVDCASKNGNLLLNVALHADGTTDPEEQKRLLQVGEWLDVNGEAIYSTRPTHLWGEGPTPIKNWLAVDKNLPAFTPKDIRFTANGDVLYAILMRLPQGKAHIQALRRGAGIFEGVIKEVHIFGCSEKIQWTQDANGLVVTLPSSLSAKATSELGIALKITGLHGLKRDGIVRPTANGTMRLNCWDAKITGEKLAPMDFEPALVNWSNPKEFPAWDFVCPAPGTYVLQANYSAPGGGGEAVVAAPGGDLSWKIAPTKNDKDFRLVDIGTIKLEKAGRYSLAVKPVQQNWKGINLSFVQLKDPVLRPEADGSVDLSIVDATRHGEKFFLETRAGVTNLGGWKSSAEWIAWEHVEFPKPGRYAIRVLGAAGDGDAAFAVSVGDRRADGQLPRTPDWNKPGQFEVGTITITKAGVYPVAFKPSAKGWNAVNLARVIFLPVPQPN